MRVAKAIMTGLLVVWVCNAQSVNIRGIVKDSAGIGIAGTTVKLEKGGQTTTPLPKNQITYQPSALSSYLSTKQIKGNIYEKESGTTCC
jgi:hypothetical protein